MARGLVKVFPAIVRPVVQFCLDHDVNILQMTCPESRCAAGGFERAPHGKAWYEERGLRAVARGVAQGEAQRIADHISAGHEVLAIVGIEFSPACGVNYLNEGRSIVPGKGILIEELERELDERSISVPFVGVSQRWHLKARRELEQLLDLGEAATR